MALSMEQSSTEAKESNRIYSPESVMKGSTTYQKKAYQYFTEKLQQRNHVLIANKGYISSL